MEGVRLNLVFSRERGLACLHWVTAFRLDWEYDRMGVGVNPDLDLAALEAKLQQLEQELDADLRAKGGPTQDAATFCLRGSIEEAQGGKSVRSLLSKAKHGLVFSRAWFYLRPYLRG